MRLLIHHHAAAFRDSQGIWVHAVIGRWAIDLAAHFSRIGLLLHETETKQPNQDQCVTNDNVFLETLGPPGRTWDRIQRIRRIKQKCRSLEGKYDQLVVRGITPRQRTVWQSVNVAAKAYLLVGSIKEPGEAPGSLRPLDVFYWLIGKHRQRELRGMLKSGRLLVNSFKTLEEVQDMYGIKGSFTPSNSISVKEFIPLRVRDLNSPVNILLCSRIEPKKGSMEAVKAVDILQKSGHDIQLDVVGPVVDHKFNEEVRSLINELKLTDQIVYWGQIPFGDDLFTFFRRADVFVLPSYTEGFPRVVWEAAASCCPVVTTAVGGIPRLFKHRHHGMLIPPRDHQALADSIAEVINDTDLRSKIVTNAYNLANEYTAEQCAKVFAETIKEGR
jgi:glycosyltransferase involved in cell wall biosynthesis